MLAIKNLTLKISTGDFLSQQVEAVLTVKIVAGKLIVVKNEDMLEVMAFDTMKNLCIDAVRL